jgi:hypothetical protein
MKKQFLDSYFKTLGIALILGLVYLPVWKCWNHPLWILIAGVLLIPIAGATFETIFFNHKNK